MTTQNTKDEWLAVIEQAEKEVPSTFTEYKAPGLDTPEFAKCMDHTLLKLGANSFQIRELCEEAKKHDFKVSERISPALAHIQLPSHGIIHP